MSKNPRLGVWFAAAAMVFFTRALLFSTWQSRSPEVQDALNLNTAEMGLLVMLFPAGGLLGIFFANTLMNRFGAGKLTIVGFSLGASSLYGLGLAVSAGNVWISAICLLGMGLPMAIADFTGNIQGTAVDSRAKRSLFPAIHAAFGVGMMLAAAFSGYLISSKIGIEFNYLVVALIVAAGSIWAGLIFPAHERKTVSVAEKVETSKLARKVWSEKRTLLIALIGFSFIMAEISAGTWLPIALTNSGFSGAEAAAAFGWFWVAITVTRAFGGFVVDKLGRFQSIFLSALLTAAGISVFVFDSVIQMPYLGIALWGMGLALGFPMSVNSMSDDPAKAAPRINMIITVVYISSILVGPVIGTIGQVFSIYAAFAVPLALMLVSAFISPVTKKVS
jgi:predicted MFS family arabinose efflux permease